MSLFIAIIFSSTARILKIPSLVPNPDLNPVCPLCLGPIGDFCIGGHEMYNYTHDASRCLAILSINTSSSDEKIDLRWFGECLPKHR